MLQDLVYRQSRDIGQALQFMLHTGKEIGRQERQPIVYAASCKRHEIPLQEVQPGVFLCPWCQTGPMSQITEPVRTSGLVPDPRGTYFQQHRWKYDPAHQETQHLQSLSQQDMEQLLRNVSLP